MLIRLRDVSASLEERAHALDVALPARTDQRRPAILIRLCDVSASCEERAQSVELARPARSHAHSPAIRSGLRHQL
jgi:hypothetical protein